MPAKSKAKEVPDEPPKSTSDASITEELKKLTVAEDEDDDKVIIVGDEELIPLNIRGIMVKDPKGYFYAPQKGMFAYDPNDYFQVASVKNKLTEVIGEERKKNPDLKVYRFKAVMEHFPYTPTKIGGIDRGYTTKFFPKEGESEDERRRKSPRREGADDDE
jgi:hypothetical protein